MKRIFNIFPSILLACMILLLYSCENSPSPSGNNNNNHNIDTTKKGDTITVAALSGYSFEDKSVHSSPDSCDFLVVISAVNHQMTIVLQAPGSKIQYFTEPPDLSKINADSVNDWGEYAPDPKSMKFADTGYYYILKAKNGKYYQLYTADILNYKFPMPIWKFIFLWKEVQIKN